MSASERVNYLIINWINGKSLCGKPSEREAREKQERERSFHLEVLGVRGKFGAERKVFMKGLLTRKAV